MEVPRWSLRAARGRGHCSGAGRCVLEIAAFVLGAALGSFANVLIHRLPRRESVVVPSSHCPRCGAPIRPWDNVPVLSYLLLRGRCRYCLEPIAPRYLIVEIVAGALFAGLAAQYGVTLTAMRFAVLAFALVVVFFTDLEWNLVPNAVTYPGIAAGILLSAASGGLIPALLAAVGAGAVFLLIAVVSRGGMGGGDIKLAAMIGAFLGPAAAAVALFLAVAIGAGAGLVLIALRLRTRKDTMPFGPALAAGAMIAVFASNAILHWYLTKIPAAGP